MLRLDDSPGQLVRLLGQLTQSDVSTQNPVVGAMAILQQQPAGTGAGPRQSNVDRGNIVGIR